MAVDLATLSVSFYKPQQPGFLEAGDKENWVQFGPRPRTPLPVTQDRLKLRHLVLRPGPVKRLP